jgi:hypothetical protein
MTNAMLPAAPATYKQNEKLFHSVKYARSEQMVGLLLLQRVFHPTVTPKFKKRLLSLQVLLNTPPHCADDVVRDIDEAVNDECPLTACSASG